MTAKNFHEVIRLICKDDPRYEVGAYFFIRQALDHTITAIRRKEEHGRQRHVTGAELCEGIREYALEQYGPMTHTLFQNWGIQSTEDFGQIVFNLVEFGVFGKTETDSLKDFEGVYDFDSAFSRPFQPSSLHEQESPQRVGRHPD